MAYTFRHPAFDSWLVTILYWWRLTGRYQSTALWWKVDGSPTLTAHHLTLAMNAGAINNLVTNFREILPVTTFCGCDWRLHVDGLQWRGRHTAFTGSIVGDTNPADVSLSLLVQKMGGVGLDRFLGRMWLPAPGIVAMGSTTPATVAYYAAAVAFCVAVGAGGDQSGMTFRPMVWRPADDSWEYVVDHRIVSGFRTLRRRRRWKLVEPTKARPLSEWTGYNGVPQ